jgi:hypothetical protein
MVRLVIFMAIGYKYYEYPDMKKIVGETFIGEKWFGHTLHSQQRHLGEYLKVLENILDSFVFFTFGNVRNVVNFCHPSNDRPVA